MQRSSALSAQCSAVATCRTFFKYFYLLQQLLLILPPPACCNSHEALQHSALSAQLLQLAVCRLSIYTFILFYFVATMIILSRPLRVATVMKFASALSCCNLPYVFYLSIYIYILLQQLLSLPSTACCNSHKAHFSASAQLLQLAVCRLSIYIYTIVSTINRLPLLVATLSAHWQLLQLAVLVVP